MSADSGFDWRRPDYAAVFGARLRRLRRLREEPGAFEALKVYYRDGHEDRFIDDWGCTYDPRNVEVGLPAVVPFLLFPRQREWVRWFVDHWRGQRDGITEKSRDMGVSWLAVSTSVVLCLLNPGLSIGFGSRTEDDVDKNGDPQSLFWKAREFVRLLPFELRGGFDGRPRTTSHMRISFPDVGSVMKGDAGDDIGRSDRTGIYVVDESAKLAHPALVDAALSQTTNCRHDISTPRGRANRFAERRFSGKVDVFTFHWRDDRRKDDAWYARQVERLDPITLAQEVDLDYSASAEGVLIPTEWLQAAVDSHLALGFEPSGLRAASLDVADEGEDTLAWCGAHGPVLLDVVEWSGKGGDVHASTERALGLCDRWGLGQLIYDADGLGAGVRGAARVINAGRDEPVSVVAFRGSAAVDRPDAQDVRGRRNKDMFANAKAQGWWALRSRFFRTFQAVRGAATHDPGSLLSVPSGLKLRSKLLSELSQPTYGVTSAGKIAVDKTPDGARSPNLADALMIRYGSAARPMAVSGEAVRRVAARKPIVASTAGVAPRAGVSAAALSRFARR